jgi:hypothetical protein
MENSMSEDTMCSGIAVCQSWLPTVKALQNTCFDWLAGRIFQLVFGDGVMLNVLYRLGKESEIHWCCVLNPLWLPTNNVTTLIPEIYRIDRAQSTTKLSMALGFIEFDSGQLTGGAGYFIKHLSG